MSTSSIDGVRDVALVLSRVARAAELRLQRYTWQQIADECGYAGKGAACNAVLTYLRKHAHENATALREVENLKLDDDEVELLALRDDTEQEPRVRIRAIEARLRLSARRSRMNGLDAPVQVQLSAGVAAELEDALSEWEDAVAGEVTAVHEEPLDGRAG